MGAILLVEPVLSTMLTDTNVAPHGHESDTLSILSSYYAFRSIRRELTRFRLSLQGAAAVVPAEISKKINQA